MKADNQCPLTKNHVFAMVRIIRGTLLTLRKGNLIFPLTSSRSKNCIEREQLPYFLNRFFFSPHNERAPVGAERSGALEGFGGELRERAVVAQSARRGET